MTYQDPLERGVKESLREGARGASGAARGLFSFSTFKFFFSILVFGILAIVLFSFGVFGDTTIGVSLGGFGQNTDLSRGLIGHWTFDGKDMTTHVADSSGSGNRGYIIGQSATSTVLGALGQALDFDGSDDYVTIPTFNQTVSTATFTAWVKLESKGAYEGIVFSRGTNVTGISLSQSSGNYLGYHWNDNIGTYNWDSNLTIPLGQWAFVAIAAEPTFATAYLGTNGALSSAVNTVGHSSTILDDLKIGQDECCGGRPTDGAIDDVRVYNRALSREEIERLYELGQTTHMNVSLGGVGENKDLSSGLVGHWTFDGPDMLTRVADASGAGNPAYLGSGFTSTTTVLGRLGQAISIDGSNDEITVPHSTSINITGNFSIAAWVNIRAHTDFNQILIRNSANSSYYGMLVGVNGNVALQVGNGGQITAPGSTTRIPTGSWVHVVGTYDTSLPSANAKIYINGVQDATTGNGTTGPGSSSVSLGIGYDPVNGRNMNGSLDDVRLYNRALSREEVTRLYGLGSTTHINTSLASGDRKTGLSDSLVGHWTFDGPNMITNVADASGAGNNGNISGQTSTSTSLGIIGQSLNFDGSDDFINIPYDFSEPSRITISLWFKTTRTLNGLFSQSDNQAPSSPTSWVPTLLINNSGQLRGEFWTGTVGAITSSGAVNDGDWHHAVLVGDSTIQYMYLDGALVGSRSGTLSQTWWVRSAIGAGYDNASSNRYGDGATGWKYMSGDIDDVRVYNRALSASEVSQLYELGR